jgi:hydroxypyruvate isomerase
MPRFAANCSMLFTEVPFPERFARAAAAGFQAVEFQFPYEWPAEHLRARLDAAGVQAVLHNLPAGDWAAGDRGLACDATRQAEFRAGVPRAIAYARALGVPRLNLLAGRAGPGQSEADTRALFIDNLRFAADALAEHGLTLLIEPINTRDVPGFWLSTSALAVDLLAEADRANAFLQFDLYHMQRMEGDLAATLRRLLPRIGHVQFADNPGRHEPGTGELNFGFLFAELDRLGYGGWVGAEYLPSGRTEDSLTWLEALP